MEVAGDIATRVSLVRPRLKNLYIRKQCDLLSINRSWIYYRPREEVTNEVTIAIVFIVEET
jgi:hypothetical protein